MRPASIPTGSCRRSRKPMPPRAAASGWSTSPRATSSPSASSRSGSAAMAGGRCWGDAAARDKLSVRQLAQRVGGYGGLAFVGTPAVIADQMEEWLTSYGCDGFNIMFPHLPPRLHDFVGKG